MQIEPNLTDINGGDIDFDGDGKIDFHFDGENVHLGFIDTHADSHQIVANTTDETYLGEGEGEIYGTPDEDAAHWHQQAKPDTCAIVSQEFILDELGEQFGIEFTEEELRQVAHERGWYTPGGGTSMNDVGKLLELHGIPVDRESHATLDDLAEKLAQGEKVIVGVNAETIWQGDNSESLTNYPGIPGQSANHAVQVIGIDNEDPDNPKVILNDPGTPNGQALTVPVEQFMNAWQASDCYLVATDIHPNPTTSG
jgi:Peptidase_C39 like family